MSKIRIKNFGPIKEGYLDDDSWLDVGKVTVFIGNHVPILRHDRGELAELESIAGEEYLPFWSKTLESRCPEWSPMQSCHWSSTCPH